jgi:hypothetical protein
LQEQGVLGFQGELGGEGLAGAHQALALCGPSRGVLIELPQLVQAPLLLGLQLFTEQLQLLYLGEVGLFDQILSH